MDEMNKLLGIGREVELGDGVKKTLRIGTVKELKEVGEMLKDDLKRLKYAIYDNDEEQIRKWLDILNIITIEGMERAELDDSIPEQVDEALNRFLFG